MNLKSKKVVAIIDYQMSNLFSVKHACDYVGLNAVITSSEKKLMHADAAILPGVGAFNEAMYNLKVFDLISPIRDFIDSGKPFFGICLGMQLLFTESEEFDSTRGLNIVEGKVVKFPTKDQHNRRIKVPHIGWNKINPSSFYNGKWDKTPLRTLNTGEYMYFVHSFYAVPMNQQNVLSTTNYRENIFCSSIRWDNVFATQFHPEKSASKGLEIYRDWAKLLKEKREKHE